MHIRTLAPHEVDLHREVRLRALADAPGAFGVIVAEVEAQPMSYWEDLTRALTGPGGQVMFLTCEGDTVGHAMDRRFPHDSGSEFTSNAILQWAASR
jgi:hypothetical protein